MSRDIPAALESNLADDVVYPFFAIELNLILDLYGYGLV